MASLSLQHIYKKYAGGVTAVSDFCLDIEDKEFIVLVGPSGCGKTTLARIIANTVNAQFIEISAVTSGVKDIKDAVERAKEALRNGQKTVLFIDEIHRYSKTQQDALLPHLENGTLFLIGSTTENPSFQVVPALLSRVQVIRLENLSNSVIYIE